MATAVAMLEIKDFKADVPPDWCPGCGDFGVLNGLFHACAELGRQPPSVDSTSTTVVRSVRSSLTPATMCLASNGSPSYLRM